MPETKVQPLIFWQCKSCRMVYDLRYFLNLFVEEKCIFCVHLDIQARL